MRRGFYYCCIIMGIGALSALALQGERSGERGSHLLLSTEAGLPPAIAVDPNAGYEPDRDPLDQGNDACPATVIGGVPYTDTGTTAGRVNNWNTAGSCAGGGGTSNAPDVIYSITPPSSNTFIISTCGSLFNTLLEVRSGGACPGSAQVACGDAGCGGDAELIVSLTGGTTYYIIVDGWGTQSGSYTLSVKYMCNVYPLAGDAIECAETADSSHARLDCNGGPCNVLFGGVAGYTTIQNRQTYFGSAFTYTRGGVQYFDTDWYRFTIFDACTVRITVTAEFPSVLSAGTYLSACADHSLIMSGNTCEAYTMVIPALAAGNYEFTIRPYDAAGISVPRDYRVTLTCIPVSGCLIDGVMNAPGSYSGTTCGEENDCDRSDGEDYTIRINIPETDDWTFSLCGPYANWSANLTISSVCCAYGDTWYVAYRGCGEWQSGMPLASCVRLEAGTYFVTIDGRWPLACGPFELNVYRCRQRCCYGEPELQTCADMSKTNCDALGGIFDDYLSCASDPCPEIAECLPGAVISQRPAGLGDSYVSSWPSDSATTDRHYERIDGSGQTVQGLRFWGVHYAYGTTCQVDPMEFTIRFFEDDSNSPGTFISGFSALLHGVRGDAYLDPGIHGDTLYEYSVALPQPMVLTTMWISIIGHGTETCTFRWFCSRQGDERSYIHRTDSSVVGSALFDMAFCLSTSCPPPRDVTLLAEGGNDYTIAFTADVAALYRFYYTTSMTSEYPAGFTAFHTQYFAAGPQQLPITGTPLYARFAVTTDCGGGSAAASAPPGTRILLE